MVVCRNQERTGKMITADIYRENDPVNGPLVLFLNWDGGYEYVRGLKDKPAALAEAKRRGALII